MPKKKLPEGQIRGNPEPVGGKRSPSHVVDMRVQEVFNYLLEGLEGFQIVGKYPDVPPGTVKRWYYKAQDLLREQMEQERDNRIKDRMAELKFLYRKAVTQEDFKLALDVVRQMSYLCGDNGAVNVNMKFQEHTPAELVLKVDGEVK